MTMPKPSEAQKSPNRRKKRIKVKRNTGDHSKLPQSLASHLHQSWQKWLQRWELTVGPDSEPETASPQRRSLQSIAKAAPLTLSLALLATVSILSAIGLTQPLFIFGSDTESKCHNKINGSWQTNWGSITFTEQPNSSSVTASYEYSNVDRGNVKGTLTGDLRNDVLDFVWQETANKGSERNGKGSFLFQNNCKDFFGSYSSGELEAGRGSWRGTILKNVPVRK